MDFCCRKVKPEPTELAKAKAKCMAGKVPKLGYYAYASNPKANQGRPKYRCEPNRPKGIHDYYNLMWDPHVYRGETCRTFQTVELERKKAIDRDSKRKFKKPPARRLGGIEIPQTPPPAEGHKGNVVDTRRFLEEFSIPVEEIDATSQTDIIDEIPPSPLQVTAKSGFDASTEIFPGELYDFEEEVTPIVETVAWKVLEQAILEFTEEEELRQLTAEQMRYEERRRLEQVRIKRLAEREQLMHAERAALMEILKKQMSEEKESEERVGAFLFSCSYLKELLPACLESLADEGFLHNKDVAEITETFMPWLETEVRREVGQKYLARAIVDDITGHVGMARENDAIMLSQLPQRPSPLQNLFDLMPEYEEYEE